MYSFIKVVNGNDAEVHEGANPSIGAHAYPHLPVLPVEGIVFQDAEGKLQIRRADQ